MRKFLAMATICILSVAALYLFSCNNNSAERQTGKAEDSLATVIARGEYLANYVAGCMDCHSKRDFTKYSGPLVPGSEGAGGFVFDQKFGLPGVLYGKNITSDPETGIGSWTNDEILRAITQGISKNGDTLFPLMPYPNFNRMAKDDLQSIIAFLRTLQPIKNQVPPRQLMVPIAAVYPAGFLQPSIDSNIRPAESNAVMYGQYLATMADCGTCHSPLTPHGPDMGRMYAGGYVFDIGTNIVASANITPDSTTGIGNWTEERFLNKFTAYRDTAEVNRNPGNQNTVMPVYAMAHMKDADLKAIYAYLRTVKPMVNNVEKFPK